MLRRNLFLLILVTLVGVARAANEAPQTMTLDGRLMNSAQTAPLLIQANLNIKILDPSKNCILYEEQQPINTTATNGYFNVQVGSAVGAPKRTGDDPHFAMDFIFQNFANIAATNAACPTGYAPAAGDARYVRLTVIPIATSIPDVLSPDLVVDSAPNALVAQSLQGIGRDGFLRLGTVTPLTQSNVENIFSTTNYPLLTDLLAGNSSKYVPVGTGGATIPTLASDPGTPAAGQMWYTGGQLKYYNGSSTQILTGSPTSLAYSITNTATSGTQSVNTLSSTYAPATNPSSGTSIVGFNHSVTTGGSANLAQAGIIADSNYAAHTTASSVSMLMGSYSGAENSGIGTVNSAYGNYTTITNTGGGAITNAYGLYVGTIDGTNKYAIYQSQSSANNYFAGKVGIGTSEPQAALDIPNDYVHAMAVIQSEGVRDLAPLGSFTYSAGFLQNGGPTYRAVFSTWSGGSDGAVGTWDYGSAVQGVFAVSWASGSGPDYAPRQVKVEISADCATYTDVGTQTLNDGRNWYFPFASQSVRCVRTTIIQSGTSGMNFASLQVLASANQGGGLPIWATNQNQTILGHTGNVGIGTLNPAVKLDVWTSGSGIVIPMAVRSNPGATGGGNQNRFALDNRYGAGNFSNELTFQGQGNSKWGVGNDLNSSGAQNFYIYDYVNSAVRFFIDSGGKVGIGTTVPVSKLDVVGNVSAGSYGGVSAAPANGLIVSGNVGIGSAIPVTKLDVAGHIANTGAAATLGSCGGGTPSLVGNDTRGSVTIGTGVVTSCVINFATAFATTPYCVASWSGTAVATGISVQATTTALTVNFSASSPSATFIYMCLQ